MLQLWKSLIKNTCHTRIHHRDEWMIHSKLWAERQNWSCSTVNAVKTLCASITSVRDATKRLLYLARKLMTICELVHNEIIIMLNFDWRYIDFHFFLPISNINFFECVKMCDSFPKSVSIWNHSRCCHPKQSTI